MIEQVNGFITPMNEEIKAYVWDKHHLKVSSLYISQVKRKCGLEVGQNYNLSKSENPKVPKCPLEKEGGCPDLCAKLFAGSG